MTHHHSPSFLPFHADYIDNSCLTILKDYSKTYKVYVDVKASSYFKCCSCVLESYPGNENQFYHCIKFTISGSVDKYLNGIEFENQRKYI